MITLFTWHDISFRPFKTSPEATTSLQKILCNLYMRRLMSTEKVTNAWLCIKGIKNETSDKRLLSPWPEWNEYKAWVNILIVVKCTECHFSLSGELTLEEFISGAREHPDIMDMLTKMMDLTHVLEIIVKGQRRKALNWVSKQQAEEPSPTSNCKNPNWQSRSTQISLCISPDNTQNEATEWSR